MNASEYCENGQLICDGSGGVNVPEAEKGVDAVVVHGEEITQCSQLETKKGEAMVAEGCGSGGAITTEECSMTWDWPCNYATSDQFDAISLHALPPDPLLPCPDLLQEFYTASENCENGLCDGDGGVDVPRAEKGVDALVIHGENINECGDQETRIDKKVVAERCSSPCGGQRAITFEELSKYFYVPVKQAAKELNMGLTYLKRKCREFGIPRWPHRKMKSLRAVINNVQELGWDVGEIREAKVRRVIDILEREREAMERMPGKQLEKETMRLRQALFKANYLKKRRLLRMTPDAADPPPAAMADDGEPAG